MVGELSEEEKSKALADLIPDDAEDELLIWPENWLIWDTFMQVCRWWESETLMASNGFGFISETRKKHLNPVAVQGHINLVIDEDQRRDVYLGILEMGNAVWEEWNSD